MKKLLSIFIIYICFTNFTSAEIMECARHLNYDVKIDQGIVIETIYFRKNKKSNDLDPKPLRTTYRIEQATNNIIKTELTDVKEGKGWTNFAVRFILDLEEKKVSRTGYKNDVKALLKRQNKGEDVWATYDNPANNLRYDSNYSCPGLRPIKIKTQSSNDNSNNTKNLEEIKKTCRSFGYKEGTEKFADCAKQLFLQEN